MLSARAALSTDSDSFLFSEQAQRSLSCALEPVKAATYATKLVQRDTMEQHKLGPPPSWDFQLKIVPPPSRRLGLPLPRPKKKKYIYIYPKRIDIYIYISETSTELSCRGPSLSQVMDFPAVLRAFLKSWGRSFLSLL